MPTDTYKASIQALALVTEKFGEQLAKTKLTVKYKTGMKTNNDILEFYNPDKKLDAKIMIAGKHCFFPYARRGSKMSALNSSNTLEDAIRVVLENYKPKKVEPIAEAVAAINAGEDVHSAIGHAMTGWEKPEDEMLVRCAAFIPGGIQCKSPMYHRTDHDFSEPYLPFSTHIKREKVHAS